LATTYDDSEKLWKAAKDKVNAALAGQNLVSLYTCPWPGQGVAESFISSGSTGYDRKVWEHLTHYYKVNAWLPRNYVMVNKGAWDGLKPETQAAIQKAADETGASCAAKSAELSNFYFEELAKNGMSVEPAGEEFLKELQVIGAKMTETWLKDAGTEGQAIIDAYKAM